MWPPQSPPTVRKDHVNSQNRKTRGVAMNDFIVCSLRHFRNNKDDVIDIELHKNIAICKIQSSNISNGSTDTGSLPQILWS